MKTRHITLALCALISLTAVSCKKDNAAETKQPTLTTIRASFEKSDDTKFNLNDFHTSFERGDNITVFSSEGYRAEFEAGKPDDNETVTFEISGEWDGENPTAPFYAVRGRHDRGSYNWNYSDNRISVSCLYGNPEIDGIEQYLAGLKDGVILACAESVDENGLAEMKFKNQCALLKLTISPENISGELSFEILGEDTGSGDNHRLTLLIEADEPVFLTDKMFMDNIYYDIENGVWDSDDKTDRIELDLIVDPHDDEWSNAIDVIIPIFPTTVNGFTVKVGCSEGINQGKFLSRTRDEEITFERNTIYDLGTAEAIYEWGYSPNDD